MRKIEELKANFKEIDEVLFKAEEDFKEIQKISERLKEFSKKMKIIEDFYFEGNWQKEREELEKHNADNFYCTSEDGIWNLSVAYREEKIKLIKQLAQEL